VHQRYEIFRNRGKKGGSATFPFPLSYSYMSIYYRPLGRPRKLAPVVCFGRSSMRARIVIIRPARGIFALHLHISRSLGRGLQSWRRMSLSHSRIELQAEVKANISSWLTPSRENANLTIRWLPFNKIPRHLAPSKPEDLKAAAEREDLSLALAPELSMRAI